MRIFLSPINPTVGDLDHNAELIRRAIDAAGRERADLAVLPELALAGYPPRDLLLHKSFVAACERRALAIARGTTGGLTVVFGTPLPCEHRPAGVTNSLLACRDGAVVARYDKRLLPTYDVFDEDRYFVPGDRPVTVTVNKTKVGLAVCEDLWHGADADADERYSHRADPIDELRRAGAKLIVAPSASPFADGKRGLHASIVAGQAAAARVPVVSIDQSGANDELIFDGAILAARPGEPARLLNTPFTGEPAVFETGPGIDGPGIADKEGEPRAAEGDGPVEKTELVEALALGIRDYVRKTGFQSVLVGLSGGIDSALTAALAVVALGPRHVTGVSMPGEHSSDHSVTDARDLADRLGIACHDAPISGPFEGFRATLDPAFDALDAPRLGATRPDLADENLQSRVRGTIMMTLSNRLGALVLTTGNKSEIAVGYSTLYGDMNGALAPLADLPKMQVYALSEHLNAHPDRFGLMRPPIPEHTITKPPSAELAPDQKDSDSLPDYEVLDEIVRRYVDHREPIGLIVTRTQYDPELVRRMVRLIDRNEYKRKQLTTSLKVSPVAFGVGRRMPIAQAWHDA
ncbi:MAG: NAD+ synthase [Planctomycetota bacterium]